MSSLVVGGVVIPVAISSPAWTRSDAVDRGRMFDGTFFASESGGATRDWTFSTTPVTQADADTYIAALSSPAAKICSGDILQIPTMCSPELPSGKPTRAASSNRVVLDFMLHEIQPAKVLLRYAPGDTITGESFSRSTVGYSIMQVGTLLSNAINVKRDSHYIGGVRTLLLEDSRISSLLWASDFSNAAWAKGSMTVTTGIVDPSGNLGACKLTATGANAFAEQNLAAGSNIVRTNTVWLRRRTGTGNIEVAAPSTGFSVVTLTGSYQRFKLVGSASTSRYGGIKITTSGDEIDAFMFDQDDASFESSERLSVGTAFTRGADSYSLPFTETPKEMTLYLRFVEKGTILVPTARLVQIGHSAGTAPRFTVYNAGANYAVDYDNSSSSVASAVPGAPVLGDTAEIMARLFGDGSVDITQSINGAAATVGTQSGAQAAGIISPWSASLVWLNSGGASNAGFTALQSLKIGAGARSLVEMRAL